MKAKIVAAFSFVVVAILSYGVLQIESVQKKVHDKKADILGTDRTIVFYSQLSNEKVKSFTDKEMRVDLEKQGEISVWLGTQKKKVISNLPYILEDN